MSNRQPHLPIHRLINIAYALGFGVGFGIGAYGVYGLLAVADGLIFLARIFHRVPCLDWQVGIQIDLFIAIAGGLLAFG